jgi:hypothetical protein
MSSKTAAERQLHKVGYFADLMSVNEEVNASIRPLLLSSTYATTRAPH